MIWLLLTLFAATNIYFGTHYYPGDHVCICIDGFEYTGIIIKRNPSLFDSYTISTTRGLTEINYWSWLFGNMKKLKE